MAHIPSLEAAKAHIASIRQGKGLSDGQELNENAADLERALKIVSDELYNKSTHFLLELIQNADDNSYNIAGGVEPALNITLYDDYLRVDCNEAGFSAKNVEAICRIGRSTKAAAGNAIGYVGEKGIGFKSVFKVADTVFISSGNYSFKFEKNGPLGMIAPIWTDLPVPAKPGYTTVYLHFNKDCNKEDLITEIKALDPRMLIFLRQLRQIHIKIDVKRTPLLTRSLSRLGAEAKKASLLSRSLTRLPDSKGQLGTVVTLCQDEHVFKYLVFTHLAKQLPAEAKREGVKESQLLLAFPVTPTLTPQLEAQQVYAFLPIRDYGLQFLLQGDFLLIANREDVDDSSNWNRVLRKEAIKGFVETVRWFNNSPLKYTWPRYLPGKANVSGFFAAFKKALLDGLAKEPVLESCAGKLVAPCTLKYLPKEWCGDDDQPLTLNTETSKKYLSIKYSRDDHELLSTFGVKELPTTSILDDLKNFVQKDPKAFRARKLDWHAKLALALLPIALDKAFKPNIASLKLIPLRDGRWCSIEEGTVFFDGDQHGLVIPTGIDLLVVDSAAAKNIHLAALYKALGVKELNPRNVVDIIIKTHNDPKFKPSSISNEALLQHAIFAFNLGWKNDSNDKFWFSYEGNRRLPADKLYMDSDKPYSATKLFAGDRTKVHFINGIYLKAMPEESERWLTWLEKSMHVAVYPRLGVMPNRPRDEWELSPEFEYLLSSHPSADVLMLLRDNWSIYSDFIKDGCTIGECEPNASRRPIALELSKTIVECQDGISRELRQTYLPTDELVAAAKGWAPFLDVPEPGDPRWELLLKPLQVGLKADLKFYLQALVQIKERNASIEQVKTFLEQIQARSHDDRAEVIKLFGENSLVFIPPTAQQPEAFWVAPSVCVWDGNQCLRRTPALKEIYPQNQSLFCNVLGVKDANLTNLIREAEAVTISDDLSYISSLFIEMEKMLKDDAFDNAAAVLRTSRIFPIRHVGSYDGFNELQRAYSSAEWFIVDCSHLQTSFNGRLPLLALSDGNVNKISRVLKKAGVEDKLLSAVVHGSATTKGDVRFLEAETNDFKRKVDSILRLIPDAEANRMTIFQQLRNVKCSSAPQVIQNWSVEYNGKTISGEPENGYIALESDDTSLHIYYAASSMGKNSSNCDLAEKLSNFCSFKKATNEYIDRKFLLLNIINETDQAEIDELLDQHRVPPLMTDDELAAEKERTRRQIAAAKGKALPPFGHGLTVTLFASSNSTASSRQDRKTRSKRTPLKPTNPRWSLCSLFRNFLGSLFRNSVKNRKKQVTVSRERDLTIELLDQKAPLVNVKVFAITDEDAATSSAADFNWDIFKANLAAGLIFVNIPKGEEETENLQGLGEVFVSKILKTKILGQDYDPNIHWTSPHRQLEGKKSRPFNGHRNTHAPFTIDDAPDGHFTSFIAKLSNIAESWVEKPPTYHLEVKSTKGGLLDSFEFLGEEFDRARRYRVPDIGYPTDVSVLVRVWNLEGGDPQITFFVDPWAWYINEKVTLRAVNGFKGFIKG